MDLDKEPFICTISELIEKINNIDGIDATRIENLYKLQKEKVNTEYKNALSKIRYCELCDKYFKSELMATQSNLYGQICYHCVFSSYYSENTRGYVDGSYNWSIAVYILNCYDGHDSDRCERREKGCCFLCDYINKKYISGILFGDIINRFAITDNDNDSDDILTIIL